MALTLGSGEDKETDSLVISVNKTANVSQRFPPAVSQEIHSKQSDNAQTIQKQVESQEEETKGIQGPSGTA